MNQRHNYSRAKSNAPLAGSRFSRVFGRGSVMKTTGEHCVRNLVELLYSSPSPPLCSEQAHFGDQSGLWLLASHHKAYFVTRVAIP